jgi:hypothetical protein
MPTRRVIKSVLRNFLGTLTSRYSDWHGYWLFGFVVSDLKPVDHDLLMYIAGAPDDTPMAHLRSLATRRFQEQLSKAGLDPIRIRQASLSVERLPGSVQINVPNFAAVGYRMRFVVRAITDLGKAYECEDTISVTPHDPAQEFRSA